MKTQFLLICIVLLALFSQAQISISLTPKSVTCYGMNNGAINTNVTGGTSPYTYQWDDGSTVQNLTLMHGGNYTVTVTDAINVSATASATVSEQAPITATISKTDVHCNNNTDGTATVIVNGGWPHNTYSWSNSATSATISNLGVGPYTVTVKDGNNCSTTATTTIIQPAALTVTATPTNVECYGNSTGSIQTIPTGGTVPYTYKWSDYSNSITNRINNITVGTYTVTITDNNGCTVYATAVITEPNMLTITTTPTNVKCFGDANASIQATPMGGTPPYMYLWSNSSSTYTISNLIAGNYTITVADVNGCTATRSTTITQPAQINAKINGQNNICQGQPEVLMATGGTTYSWSMGLGNMSNVVVSPAYPTTYTVTVSDANLCSAVASFTVNVNMLPIPTITGNSEICKGASTVLTAHGGLSYKWDNGWGIANPITVTPMVNTTYTLTVTDPNNCTNTSWVKVTVDPLPTVTTDTRVISCWGGNDGTAVTVVTGGTPGYTYLWSNSSTTSFITNLVDGPYYVTVTDSKGCSAIAVQKVWAPSPLDLTPTTFTNVTTKDANDGTLTPKMLGGTAPYYYTINNVVIDPINLPLTNLKPGSYVVIGTDANACITSKTFTIGYQLADSLYAQTDTCVVDFLKPIDNLSIASFKVIDKTHVLVKFNFTQAGIAKSVSATLIYSKEGWNVINLTLTCNVSTLKSLVVTRTLSDTIFISYADIKTGIISLENNKDIKLYPNPTNDILNIDLITNKPEAVNISIINQLGEVVLIANETINGTITKQINVQGLAPGMYFVTIISDSINRTEKVLVK